MPHGCTHGYERGVCRDKQWLRQGFKPGSGTVSIQTQALPLSLSVCLWTSHDFRVLMCKVTNNHMCLACCCDIRTLTYEVHSIRARGVSPSTCSVPRGGTQHGQGRDSQVGGAQAEHGAVRDDGSGATVRHFSSFPLLLPLCLAFQVHVATCKDTGPPS